LDDLAASNFKGVNDALTENILQFYSGYGFPSTKYGRLDKCVVERWRQTVMELNQLKAEQLLKPALATTALSAQPASSP
jgi:hypothetical protein